MRTRWKALFAHGDSHDWAAVSGVAPAAVTGSGEHVTYSNFHEWIEADTGRLALQVSRGDEWNTGRSENPSLGENCREKCCVSWHLFSANHNMVTVIARRYRVYNNFNRNCRHTRSYAK